jgi:hypothetical protein
MIPIATLSDEQAQRALLAFFDSLPAELWPEGSPPSPGRVTRLVERAEEQMPAEAAAVTQALRDEANRSAQAVAARWALQELAGNEEFRPLVEAAAEGARVPHMSPVPPEVGYIAIAVLAMACNYTRSWTRKTTTKEVKDGAEVEVSTETVSGFKFNLLDSVTTGLPALLKAIPFLGSLRGTGAK